MGEIRITKYPNNGSSTAYIARNFRNLIFNTNIPIDITPLAEDKADSNMLLKLMNNVVKVSFEWTISDEATSPIRGGDLAGKTSALHQWEWFKSEISQINKKGSIEDKYSLLIRFSTTDASVPHFASPGLPSGLNMVMTSEQPLTFNASMEFTCGKPIG